MGHAHKVREVACSTRREEVPMTIIQRDHLELLAKEVSTIYSATSGLAHLSGIEFSWPVSLYDANKANMQLCLEEILAKLTVAAIGAMRVASLKPEDRVLEMSRYFRIDSQEIKEAVDSLAAAIYRKKVDELTWSPR